MACIGKEGHDDIWSALAAGYDSNWGEHVDSACVPVVGWPQKPVQLHLPYEYRDMKHVTPALCMKGLPADKQANKLLDRIGPFLGGGAVQKVEGNAWKANGKKPRSYG